MSRTSVQYFTVLPVFALLLACASPWRAEASEAAFNSIAEREIDRIIGSPLRRLPSKARARGWAEVGFHARAGEGPGRIIVTPLGTGYYQLADPVHVLVTLGGVGELVLEGDETFQAEAHTGNPYFGFGFDLPVEGVGLQLMGGLALPLAVPGGAGALSFAQGMRGLWDAWLWAPRRLSPVVGLMMDAGAGSATIGGEAALAPMFWFGEGSSSLQLATQIALHAGLVMGEVVELGLRGSGASTGDGGMQLSSELYVNIDGGGDRVYHARLTLPLNEPYGFAFGPGGLWALHIGAGLVF